MLLFRFALSGVATTCIIVCIPYPFRSPSSTGCWDTPPSPYPPEAPMSHQDCHTHLGLEQKSVYMWLLQYSPVEKLNYTTMPTRKAHIPFLISYHITISGGAPKPGTHPRGGPYVHLSHCAAYMGRAVPD